MPVRDPAGRPVGSRPVSGKPRRAKYKAVAGPARPGTRPAPGQPGGRAPSPENIRRHKRQKALHPRRYTPGYVPKKKHPETAARRREKKRGKRLTREYAHEALISGETVRKGRQEYQAATEGKKAQPAIPRGVRTVLGRRSALSRELTRHRKLGLESQSEQTMARERKARSESTEAGLFGFAGKGMQTKVGPVTLDVEDVGSLGVTGLVVKKGTKLATKKIAKAGGPGVATKTAATKAAKRVRTYPARKVQRIKTYPARKKAQVKAIPSRVKTAPKLPAKAKTAVVKKPVKAPARAVRKTVSTAVRHPVKATAGGYAAASPVLAASGTSPDAPVELVKAQVSEAAKNPGRYIRRSGAFIPGAFTGAATMAANVAASPFTGGESGRRAFKELVASNKELAGYLSSDPQKQKKLAEEYGAGPAVVAALPLAARRSRKPKTELKKVVRAKGKPVERPQVSARQREAYGPISRRRQRIRMARKVTAARQQGQSNITRAQRGLYRDKRKKSTYAKLDEPHKRAAIFMADARVVARQDLDRIAKRGDKTKPGTDPHTASWLLERLDENPNYLRDSGLERASRDYAGQTGRLDTRLLGETEQQIRREAPHMQERGIPTPSIAQKRRVASADRQVKKARRQLQRASTKNETVIAGSRLKRAKAKLAEARKAKVTTAEQEGFLSQAKQIREAEGRPEPGYTKQTPLTALEKSELSEMAPAGRGFRSVGTRLRKRTGKTQEKGTRAIDVAESEHADIVAPRHRNMLVDITDSLTRERHVLTRDEMKAISDQGVKFRPDQNRGSLTQDQARAAVRAGVFDSKKWVFMPESKRLYEEALQRPDQLAGKLAQPGQSLNTWLDTTAQSWGKKTTVQAVPRTLAEEWVSQAIRSSETLGKIARTSGRVQSAALLAHSLFWVPAQIIIEGATAASQVGVHRWPGLVKDIAKMSDEQKSKLDADAGQAAALGQLDDWGKRRQSTTDFVKEGDKLRKGFWRSHWHKPITGLFTGAIKLDRFKGHQLRRIVQFGKAVKAADVVRRAADLTKKIPNAKKYEWLEKNHPEVLKEVTDNTMDMMGDWSSVTRSGKLGGERIAATGGLFYGMVRYTTHFILSAFPRQHPIVAPLIYMIGIQNTKRLEELLGGDPDYLSQLMQAMVYTKGSDKPPKPADISRIVPGGNPALELGLSAKARPTTALRLAQPIISTTLLPYFGLDPQSGRPIVPPGATVTRSGKVLQKGGKVEGLTGRQTVKAALGATTGLSSGVRLAEQITGRTGRGVGPGGELNLPFTKAPKFGDSPSSKFYDAVLPSSGEKLKKGLAPPLATLPAWKQRAIREYQYAKEQKEFLGNLDVRGDQFYPDDLIARVNAKQLTKGQAKRAFKDGLRAMKRMHDLELAAKNGTLKQMMERRIGAHR